MIQRDFILRLIEQLGAMVRALLSGRLEHGQLREDEIALDNAAEQGLGLSLATLGAMSPDEILELFRSGGGTFESRTALAGCILAAAAQLAESTGDALRAGIVGRKALYLFDQLRGNPALTEDYGIEQRIGDLIRLLKREQSR